MLSSFGEEDFQMFALNLLCSKCFSLLFRRKCRGGHHLNKHSLHMPMDYFVSNQRILFTSFGEEDFQRFCIKFAMFKMTLAIISRINVGDSTI